jgi:hypothetical protein
MGRGKGGGGGGGEVIETRKKSLSDREIWKYVRIW